MTTLNNLVTNITDHTQLIRENSAYILPNLQVVKLSSLCSFCRAIYVLSQYRFFHFLQWYYFGIDYFKMCKKIEADFSTRTSDLRKIYGVVNLILKREGLSEVVIKEILPPNPHSQSSKHSHHRQNAQDGNESKNAAKVKFGPLVDALKQQLKESPTQQSGDGSNAAMFRFGPLVDALKQQHLLKLPQIDQIDPNDTPSKENLTFILRTKTDFYAQYNKGKAQAQNMPHGKPVRRASSRLLFVKQAPPNTAHQEQQSSLTSIMPMICNNVVAAKVVGDNALRNCVDTPNKSDSASQALTKDDLCNQIETGILELSRLDQEILKLDKEIYELSKKSLDARGQRLLAKNGYLMIMKIQTMMFEVRPPISKNIQLLQKHFDVIVTYSLPSPGQDLTINYTTLEDASKK